MKCLQIQGKHDKQQGNQEELAQLHLMRVVLSKRTRSIFFLQGIQDCKDIVVNDLPFRDDQLVFLDHSVCERHLGQRLVLLLFRHGIIIHHIGEQYVQQQSGEQLHIDTRMSMFHPLLNGLTGRVHGI